MTPSLRDRARTLAQQLILIDGHIDVPYRLSIYPADLSVRAVGGDFDYERAKEGGLSAAFLAVYVAPHYQANLAEARRVAHGMIDAVWAMQNQAPDRFAVALTPADVRDHHARGLVSIPMGLENGAPIGKDLRVLRQFFDRGIRYITLCHGKDNQICDSSYDDRRTHGGLSAFGRTLIPAMNKAGMMIDVSHVSDDACRQVLDLAEGPIVATHSSARHFTPDWERNLSDDLIQRIAAKDGVVMVSFGSAFLSNAYRAEDDRLMQQTRKEMQSRHLHRGAQETLVFFAEARRRSAVGTCADVADHIDHMVQLAGIDHVGLGSDFDGVFALPKGLQDVAGYPNLIEFLLRRNYKDEDIAKILGGNTLRAWEQVLAQRGIKKTA